MSAIPQQEEAPEFKPFVPPESTGVPELTFRAVFIGALLGLVFAASSVYLGLKVGLTVSASIPVAVISITAFKWLQSALGIRKATILENNISQTTGSAGESIAAGVAFTLPSLLLMGFEMELARILLVSLLGGLIGVLMMIPLRHGLIVKEHGKLMYPEGTACGDVLIVGERGGTSAATVFLGFFVGLGYALLNLVLRLWAEGATFAGKIVTFGGTLKGAALSFETSPPMLGVGYIIGPKVAATMMSGGVLAYLILVPLIMFFGSGLTEPIYPASVPIGEMSGSAIRNAYILYIGAGAVATGGFISLARSIPTILSAFAGGLRSLQAGQGGTAVRKRTEEDLSMRIVLGGSLALAVAIAIAPVIDINPVSAVLIVLFGFFFVTVSSRITGEIGSSSNPISGMTIATLLITCGLFVAVGWTGTSFKAMALTTAALVCVAASNGGTISQDLKTGFLVGGTPKAQQIAILIGVVTSALVIGVTMQVLDKAATSFQAIEIAGFTAEPGEKTEVGPDGKTYRVLYVNEEIGPIEAGSYLVDDEGRYAFRVGTPVNAPQTTVKVPEDSTTMRGPDGNEYRIVEIGADAATRQVPAGDYLADADGRLAFRIFEPVSFPGFVAKVPADAPTRTGPDGKTFRVVQVTETVPAILRGRYLVDESSRVTFAVDPSVSREYPWRLQPRELAGQTLTIPAGARTELGLDRKPYSVVSLDESQGSVPAGRYLVDESGTVRYEARPVTKFDAPKAQLFRLIIDGTLGGDLPWALVLIGVFIAITMELVGVSSLPFAVGLYLPLATSGGIFVGGIVRWLVDRKRKDVSAAEAEFSPGMLMASGLIAGGAIGGVLYAFLQFAPDFASKFDVTAALARRVEESGGGGFAGSLLAFLHGESFWPMTPFLLMAAFLYWVGAKRKADA